MQMRWCQIEDIGAAGGCTATCSLHNQPDRVGFIEKSQFAAVQACLAVAGIEKNAAAMQDAVVEFQQDLTRFSISR